MNMTALIEKSMLTKRQLEIVKLYMEGKSIDEIAVAIGITHNTLHSAINEMHRKFLAAVSKEA